ncbi:kinesin-like protein KIF18A [Pseudomyrmex gracilis]|uniref:kinesin-like protein KIF18A n=1 Tax=Pseudomyrmex gracilis TaxID=219809 RepID=UPI000995228C|nr:kinesin-like protein KIF18A [Pseudomyrmex gracilis]XP_020295702.1 kinesin-like protein KIF18A [Pseudomyrmex gracilis]XP_020295703.1 kinesin-like protein KIF18A [Pseudomyrmex gracilis]
MVFNKKDSSKTFLLGKANREAEKTLIKPSTSKTTMKPEDSPEMSIKVIVRVRPDNEYELQNNGRTVIEVVDDKMLIFDPKEQATPFFFHNVAQKGRDMLKKQNKQLQFIFDRIFDRTSTNIDVFEGSTKSLISSLLEGYNCSVFAYGATGAGKTHTMLGNKEDPGITYRTVAELFSEIETQSKHREFNLGVTYLEIYNENVQDLLHKSGPLHLREDGRCGVIVAGLEPIAIQSAKELLTLLAEGNKNRTQHPTDANKESSRSHAVFQVYIKILNKLDNQVQRVKLSMIDLAGSERASATGCKGVRFKEGANINKSLLALGNCINNLADGIKHIPYRDSKLTRLLKDSLGGNCYTVMIANVGPSSMTYEDTYNTLRYANRAKKIKSYAKKNVSCETHVAGYIKIVEEQKKEIESLKSKLAALESGTLQPVQEIKQNKVILDVYCKLSGLYNKKKELIEKILALESSDKILAFRILYKKDADERLHNLTTAGDVLQEEQNVSGKLRINKSLDYFQRQRDYLKAQIEETWQELCAAETVIQEVTTSQLKSGSIDENLQNKLSLQISEIEKCWIFGMQQHLKKFSSLMQCERQSINTITKLMSNTLQNYYNIVKGYGSMTEKMEVEFKELVKLLEGFRNIKWSDSDSISTVEDFCLLTCLSMGSINPLNNSAPIITTTLETDNEERDVSNMNVLNSTFIATSEANIDKTFNLNDESNDHDDNISNNKSKNLQETPSDKIASKETFRKRVLSDKNNDTGSTPPKQTKKSLANNKFIVQNNNSRVGKENANKQKPVQMSEKSIAILNKLKTNTSNLTTSHSSQHDIMQEKINLSLKAMHNKERRGLMSTHPYHKPTCGKKHTPAKPSTRVPW